MRHIMINTWKVLFRNKANTFWILFFPIILGTLFNLAFSNIASDENFSTIPIAVILTDDDYGTTLKTSIDNIASEDEPMLKPTYCEEEKAMALLEDQKVTGIIYAGETVTLTVSSNMANESLSQSILQSFVSEYNMYQTSIVEIAQTNPAGLEKVLSDFKSSSDYNKAINLSRKQDANPFSQYFFNLIAMTCLFTASGGVTIAVNNQANLSDLAIRKCLSPTHKLVTINAQLIATALYEFLLNLIGFAYMAFLLKVDVLSRAPLAILTLFLGCLCGISLGFFIGSIGTASADVKNGLVFAVVMPLCFLSGLMVGNMKIIIQNNCPILNKLNPATIITDAYYSLQVYESYDRYLFDILSLLLFSAFFCFVGFLITRREKYASL